MRRCEDTSEFDSDVSRANDGDALWERGKVEKAVGADAEGSARDLVVVRKGRFSTNSDADLVGLEHVFGPIFLRHFDLIGALQPRPTLVVLDIFLREIIVVDAVKALDISVTLGLETCPVKFRNGLLVGVAEAV
jgi:hypothetical protein